jgi:hypothetical protein
VDPSHPPQPAPAERRFFLSEDKPIAEHRARSARAPQSARQHLNPGPGKRKPGRLPQPPPTSPAQHQPPRARELTRSFLPTGIIVEIPLFMETLHSAEKKHGIDVRKHHAMRMHHGNRLGRKHEMSEISGKGTLLRLPYDPPCEKTLAGWLLHPGTTSDGLGWVASLRLLFLFGRLAGLKVAPWRAQFTVRASIARRKPGKGGCGRRLARVSGRGRGGSFGLQWPAFRGAGCAASRTTGGSLLLVPVGRA